MSELKFETVKINAVQAESTLWESLVQVSEWSNGEGFDLQLTWKNGSVQHLSITWDEFEIMKGCVDLLQKM